MDALIALAVFIVLTPILVIGAALVSKIIKSFKKSEPPISSHMSSKIVYSCPNCSADLTDFLDNKSAMGRPYLEYGCNCGCNSSWDLGAHPYICVRSKIFRVKA
jgi:hypothetical protein